MSKQIKFVLISFCFIMLTASSAAHGQTTFTNPIAVGQDPCVVLDGGRYLWIQSDNEIITLHVSDTLTDLGREHVIWTSPESGPYSAEIWAPELLKLNNRWYIYFGASNGENINHRTYVLVSKTSDPLGDYTLHGPLYTGDHFDTKQENLWAIDMTILKHEGRLYGIWSGWTTVDSDVQNLYIAPMSSPTETSGNRVLISESDDYLWERTEESLRSRGLNEGPQLLRHNGRTFVVYSCAASWLPTYKLGLLELVGTNPLDPKSWKKSPQPIFESTEATFGVGHGSFTTSPDGTRWWHAYHVKDSVEPGWKRSIFVQPMNFKEDGTPDLGTPVKAGEPLVFP